MLEATLEAATAMAVGMADGDGRATAMTARGKVVRVVKAAAI